MQITTNSEKETFEFAKKYAKKLRGGEVIGLVGDLGAGKTVFAKGLAAGLGIKETITSPTFVIMKIYQIQNSTCPSGRREFKIKNLAHIDAYRVKTPQDIIAIGANEYFNRSDAVTIIEWADKIKGIKPTKTISLKYTSQNSRKILIEN